MKITPEEFNNGTKHTVVHEARIERYADYLVLTLSNGERAMSIPLDELRDQVHFSPVAS